MMFLLLLLKKIGGEKVNILGFGVGLILNGLDNYLIGELKKANTYVLKLLKKRKEKQIQMVRRLKITMDLS